MQTKTKEKKQRKLPKSVRPEEFKELIKIIPKDDYSRVAFLLGYGAGMRVSEIIRCSAEHFKGNHIFIPPSKYGVERVVPIPKGWKDEFTKKLPLKVKVLAVQRKFRKYCTLASLNPKYSMHCVSSDTQILTIKNGWKKYTEIKKNDKILSYNIEKDLIETDKILNINIYNYKDKIYQIKNKYLDMLLTPEHRLIADICIRKNGKYIYTGLKQIEIQEIINKKYFRNIKHKLSAKKYLGNESIGIYRAGLIGWLLSDGNIYIRKGRKPEITISQSYSSNKNKCIIIENLLKQSKLEYTSNLQNPSKNSFSINSKMMVFRILSGNIKNIKWIEKFINLKSRTPKFLILKLKQEELLKIYEMMMLGDGSRNSEYCSQNIKRIEFIQILSIFLGKRCLLSSGIHNLTHKEKFRTFITNNTFVQIRKKHISQIDYKGKVWCPTTKNETWIARRNNKVFITSNSLRHGFATRLIENNVPINQIQLLMGHSDISTTGIYLKANPKDALKSYEELF